MLEHQEKRFIRLKWSFCSHILEWRIKAAHLYSESFDFMYYCSHISALHKNMLSTQKVFYIFIHWIPLFHLNKNRVPDTNKFQMQILTFPPNFTNFCNFGVYLRLKYEPGILNNPPYCIVLTSSGTICKLFSQFKKRLLILKNDTWPIYYLGT